MDLGKQLLLLSVVIVLGSSIQPNCDPHNQFRKYCFLLKYCNEYECRFSNCGHFNTDSDVVKIGDTQIIPKCAFSNAPLLQYIAGVNSGIQVLAGGSFVNLPSLKGILLSFNLIRELHSGIFKNVTVISLDLSWNKIVYVHEEVFDGITGLQYLNLSRNELKTLPVHRMPPFLTHLDLSHNVLNMIALNSMRSPNLTKIDLSYNILKGVAFLFEHTVKKIDLSHNRLKDIDFYEVQECEEFEIPSNYFSKVPEFLTYSNIKRVSLYPNPWKCEELTKLWVHLQNNFVNVLTEAKTNKTEVEKPICSANSADSDKKNSLTNENENVHIQCTEDYQCDVNMVCRGLKCLDPCQENICDNTSMCKVYGHRVECLCPQNRRRDPRDVYSPCHDTECFSNEDCTYNNICFGNNTCGRIPTLSIPSARPIPPPVMKEPWWFNEIPKLYSSKMKSME